MPKPAKSAADLRAQVAALLTKGHAHVAFPAVVNDWPPHLRGKTPERCPYTGWQVLEHMRIAQWDILEFTRDPKHVSPKWPQGYWPDSAAPSSEAAWQQCISAFQRDLSKMLRLVRDPKNDLHKKIPHGTGQTLLREALLLADHNSYHLGQLVLIRRLLAAWQG